MEEAEKNEKGESKKEVGGEEKGSGSLNPFIKKPCV